MAKRVQLTSDGEDWTFVDGRTATFVDRKGRSNRANFRVVEIIEGSPLIIRTDLTGISWDHKWGPVIEWWGPAVVDEVD